MARLALVVGCSQTVVLELSFEECTVSAKQQRFYPGVGASGGSGPFHQPLGALGGPDSGGKGSSHLSGDLAGLSGGDAGLEPLPLQAAGGGQGPLD